MLQIKSLEGIGFTTIYNAFNEAFADYDAPPLYLTQLKQMVTRRGFDPTISFGAFENEKLVSFTLNGRGSWNGLSTAYDTGTGTIKEYRGKGLAKGIFRYSIPILKKNGLSQYLLEVMQTNKKAVNLYQKQGFDIVREFDFYIDNKKDVAISNNLCTENISIKETNLQTIERMSKESNKKQSWQNSLDSIKRGIEKFTFIGAFQNDELLGYVVSELNTGDITQLFVAEKNRRKKIATQLFSKVVERIPGDDFKLINVEKSNVVMKAFLVNIGIQPKGSQFEMMMPIK